MIIDDLRRVRDLLDDPQRWTQGTAARDSNGHMVVPDSDDAVCWCLSAALSRVLGATAWSHAWVLVATVLAGLGSPGLISFNDSVTHADVLALLDLAIQTAEKEAK